MVSKNQSQQQSELAGYLGYRPLAIARRVNRQLTGKGTSFTRGITPSRIVRASAPEVRFSRRPLLFSRLCLGAVLGFDPHQLRITNYNPKMLALALAGLASSAAV